MRSPGGGGGGVREMKRCVRRLGFLRGLDLHLSVLGRKGRHIYVGRGHPIENSPSYLMWIKRAFSHLFEHLYELFIASGYDQCLLRSFKATRDLQPVFRAMAICTGSNRQCKEDEG